jgi:phosphatidylserine/phosphatidylglycerophosphate/cardiolipin synthase-like enzyme
MLIRTPQASPAQSPSRTFKIGDATLNSDIVSEKSIKEMVAAAVKSGVEPKKPFDIQELQDSWLETGTISETDFQKISSLHWYGSKKFNAIKGEWWDAKGANDKAGMDAADQKMAPVARLLELQTPINDEYRVATANALVSAIAGASFGPTATVSAYAAWNGLKAKDVESLVDTLNGWEKNERIMNEGNQVKQVHREHLWKAKHELLDEAKASAVAGNPTEVDLQYYELTSNEILGKVADAAKAGNKVRVNVDPGRLSYPDKDNKGNVVYEVDDIPDKMRAIIQLTSLDADVGVSVYPALKNLGKADNLMHRKLMRVGNKALLPGMNANNGSGENIDAGYILEGPVVTTLIENFDRDVSNSLGAGRDEIWGDKQKKMFNEDILRMGTRGLSGLFDVLSGPKPAGEEAAKIDSYESYLKLANAAGVDPKKMLDVPADELESRFKAMLEGSETMSLSAYGKAQLSAVIDRALAATQTDRNIEKMKDITPPERAVAGKTTVAIADQPVEREAMMVKAISEAEEFIYVPGFVVTRGVASAIAARRDELAAKGQELEVKVVADSGVYPGGSTPNSWGVKFLEDKGIDVRWSKLTRTGWHDRKIHAKQLITDKHEMFGSTNFSKKAMQENWEHSGLVSFDPKDSGAMANREESISQFMTLWNNETFELNSIGLATAWSQNKPEEGRGWFVESSRDGAIKKTIGLIEAYEEATAEFIQAQREDTAISHQAQKNRESGMSEGYSLLKAVESEMGVEALTKALSDLPASKELNELTSSLS